MRPFPSSGRRRQKILSSPPPYMPMIARLWWLCGRVHSHSVQDGKVRRADKDGGVGTIMFAQGGYKSGGVGDDATDDISDCFTAAFRKGGSTISGKTVDIEHRYSPDH